MYRVIRVSALPAEAPLRVAIFPCGAAPRRTPPPSGRPPGVRGQRERSGVGRQEAVQSWYPSPAGTRPAGCGQPWPGHPSFPEGETRPLRPPSASSGVQAAVPGTLADTMSPSGTDSHAARIDASAALVVAAAAAILARRSAWTSGVTEPRVTCRHFPVPSSLTMPPGPLRPLPPRPGPTDGPGPPPTPGRPPVGRGPAAWRGRKPRP